MQRILSTLSVLLILHPLVGCVNLKKPPTHPQEDRDFGAVAETPPGLDNDQPVPLVLLPGDTITVRTSSNESSEYENLVIDSEGKVHVPIIGAAQVEGLAPQQAERTIEGMMQKFDRFVRVNVLVTAWSGHTATVIGAVVSEGAKAVAPGMRVAELISAAGGPLRTTETEVTFVADLDGAKLIRDKKVVPVSLRLAMNGDPRHNVFVHAGDQLFVPAGLGNRIAVLGSDAREGALLPYRPGMRLTEALASGGGINLHSDEEDIRIVRGSIAKPLVYRFDLEDLIDGKSGDIELAAGDVVYVDRHWSSVLGEVLDRAAPLIQLGLAVAQTAILVQNYKLQRKIFDELNDDDTTDMMNNSATGTGTPAPTR